MRSKVLESRLKTGINEAGRNGAGNTETALTETRTVGGSAMTANADEYTDSGSTNNREQSSNWKSIGELARRLVEAARK